MGWLTSLLDISLTTANRFYAWGWGFSVTGAVITMIGIGMLWFGTRVRDHDFEEQMASLHSKAGAFEKDAAEARKQTAAIQKQSAEIQLDLEKERIARLRLEEQQRALQQHQAQRRLTNQQKQEIITTISAFRGQKLIVNSLVGDADAKAYAEEFASVFEAAGWDHDGLSGMRMSAFIRDPVGLFVLASKIDFDSNTISPGIHAFYNTATRLGLVADNGIFPSDVLPKGYMELRVGKKPPL